MTTSLIERAVRRAGPRAVADILKDDPDSAYIWRLWARPNQLPPPGDWLTWFLMMGRGAGKTRTGAEFIKERVDSGEGRRIAFLGRAPGDVRDTMVEGESGILSVFPRHQRPIWEPTKRRITFHTGATVTTFSNKNPEQLRGPQFDTAWVDELGTFATAEAFDNLQLALRLGRPRQVVTTTPRPIRVIRDLVKDPDTVVVRGSSYENRANLSKVFWRQVIRRYVGTRRGQQEIQGILLDDVPGALWTRDLIKYRSELPEMKRILVGVDPSVSSSEGAAECGIVGGGEGVDGNYYVMADRSKRASPAGWAKRVVATFDGLGADRVIGEVNNGGEMVELTLRAIDRNIPFKAVHASVGKKARAEPISALYEQGKVFHVQPFEDLEDQLCTWVPDEGPSPDRLDALVWMLSELSGRRVGRADRVLEA